MYVRNTAFFDKKIDVMQPNGASVHLMDVRSGEISDGKAPKQGENMTQLIKRAKNGDAEAFIRLMEDNKESMKRIAFAYLKSEEDVADVLQETILDAFEHIHTLRKPEYFRTWLVRILLNNCAAMYRHSRRQQVCDLSGEARGCYAAQENLQGVETQSDLEFLDLLSMLPEDSRMVFQLYFGEQYSISQIAEILKINENTVKSRLRRGKERLRETI